MGTSHKYIRSNHTAMPCMLACGIKESLEFFYVYVHADRPKAHCAKEARALNDAIMPPKREVTMVEKLISSMVRS